MTVMLIIDAVAMDGAHYLCLRDDEGPKRQGVPATVDF